MGRKGDDRLYQFVDDLVSVGARDVVEQLGVDEAAARELMRGIAHGICTMYARSYMYVPLDMEFELSARDKDIWRKYGEDSSTAGKFTASRIAELSEEYKMTTVQLYAIVRLMRTREQAARAREFSARQGVIPGLDDAPGDTKAADPGSRPKG